MTNREWLQRVSANELAETMVDISERVCEKYCSMRWDTCSEDCVRGIKDWLGEEHKDD